MTKLNRKLTDEEFRKIKTKLVRMISSQITKEDIEDNLYTEDDFIDLDIILSNFYSVDIRNIINNK